MNQFTTQTNASYVSKKLTKQTAFIFLAMSVCCLLALMVSVSFFLMCEIFCAAVCLFTYQATKRTRHWKLEFVDDELNLTNCTTGEHYNFYATPASDCVMRQTSSEKNLNYGTLKIKHTMISYISGIENFDEMKQYILENFAKYG